jgi:hypothetical protein
MAKTVLPIAGAVVGAFFGAPQIGFAVGSLLASAIPGEAQGPRIGETGAQTSQEGAPRAIIYGTCACTGNVIASGPLIKRDVEENQGGKGGTDVSTEHAYRTFAVRVCEGPIGGFLRIWEDDKLVYDIRPDSAMLAESALWAIGTVFYLGDEEQLPDPSLQMIFGSDNVPSHRGSAYIVFIEKDLTDRRGSIPQYRAEVAAITDVGLSLGPLVVNPWITVGGRPVHSDGETVYTVDGVDYTDFPSAVLARSTNGDPASDATQYSTEFIAYSTSIYRINNIFDDGATLAGNPETVSYKTAAMFPDQIIDPSLGSGCSAMKAEGATVGDGIFYGAQHPTFDEMFVQTLYDETMRPTTGPFSGPRNFCLNYAPVGSFFPALQGTPVLNIPGIRKPGPPPGWALVAGTAKQLAVVEYRDGALYQNGLGPVLLPDDEHYDDDAFWDSARDAAVLVGTMASDVSYPIVVSEYSIGTSTQTGVPVPLGAVVSDIHARCNFPAEKFDVSELTDPVSGLVLAGDYTGADAINTLRSLYLFDRADYDKKIHYPKRGAAVVATLTIDDLVEEPDTSTRQQAIEYPKKLHLTFQSAITGYAPAKATSARSSPDVRVVGETTVQIPVVLNADQAARAANILHKVAWAEAEGEVKLSIPDSFLRFVSSNCLGLSLRGRVSRLRIEQMDVADGVIALTMRYDRQSAYTSNVTGIPLPEPMPPPSTIVGDTVLAVIDMSPRADNEDDLHYLVAVTAGMPAWHGATVQRSLDAGANYTTAASVDRAAVMGSLVTDLADASEHFTDTTNVICVQLYRDGQSIEDITDAQFLSEGGAFVIMRPDGSCEVLQYRDAAEVSTGVYDLSCLHRGLLNSGTSAHLAGALLVMLNRAEHVTAQSAWIGSDLTHRAPSFDQSPELADEQTETYTGKSQTEWPVAYLTLSREGGNVITGTWTPRYRLGTDDAPVNSANMVGYRVTLDDGVLAPVIFDTTVATFTYDASALGDPLTVSVAALNRITGAGPAESGSV